MSSVEDVLRADPLLRVAISIGDQGGVDKGWMTDEYEKVCLGEIAVGAFFVILETRISDPALKDLLLQTQRKLATSTLKAAP